MGLRPDSFLDVLLWIGDHVDQFEPVIEMDEKVWFRKRHEMSHIASYCGISDEFKCIGDYIHQDDLHYVQEVLGVTDDCMQQLFVESELPGRG